jgi:hypothetical protein
MCPHGLHSLVAQVVLRSDDALEVLYEGEKNRHFAATAMNNHSSRRYSVWYCGKP